MSKLADFWDDLTFKNTFVKKIDHTYYNIKRGILNIITWFPVIWNDRDWDHWHLYNILYKKLEMMENLQRNHGCHVDNVKVADQIKVCKLLLKRLIDDNYLENATVNHDKKWGELSMFTREIEGSDCVSMHTKTTKDLTEKESEIERVERHRLYKHSDNMKEQDLDMLFRIIRKRIQGWWD